MRALRVRERGFTLIEVLIVVVIIGALAALVVPRFMAATEKAIVAEANQMLGSLIRAQQARSDMEGAFVGTGTLSSANWATLGLGSPATAKFTFSCATPTCSAARTVNTVASTAALNMTTQVWACSGAYTPFVNGGCALA